MTPIKSDTEMQVAVTRRIGLILSILSGCTGLIYGLSRQEKGDDHSIPAAERLDALGREKALELRMQTLEIHGVPYQPVSQEVLMPISNQSCQRLVSTEFVDARTGLMIRANTHLCLPGVDTCISGGEVIVSDGDCEWRITFQLLGSSNPSPFHSHLPRSRDFLEKLEFFAAGTQSVSQEDYYQSLERMLVSSEQPSEQENAIRDLTRLLLRSYFNSEQYSDTLTFAVHHDLLVDECYL